ncbi:hypothetical protein BaRGS_00013473 [Batillaria attramentaria]|uniref:GTP-binding protein 8 n=1 Tax=Batillaria attramentaria TaxID=370345 RepID=A0ABD0L7R2_9CAEN
MAKVVTCRHFVKLKGIKISWTRISRETHFACQFFTSNKTCTASQGISFASRGIKSRTTSACVNPLLELQGYVATPIVPADKAVFTPSQTEVTQALKLFSLTTGTRREAATFVGSYADASQLPDTSLPEVAFLGRSNVGKSSLIQCLLRAHSNVHVSVSKTPGHTRTLNLYRLGQHFTLVDMPGYGYNMPLNFQQSVELYLQSSRRLCRTFLLLDGQVGLTKGDHTAIQMLREFGVPYVVVVTKIDKVGRHVLLRNLLSVMEYCHGEAGHTCFSQPFLVSSRTQDGVTLLQTFIAYITGCVRIQGL